MSPLALWSDGSGMAPQLGWDGMEQGIPVPLGLHEQLSGLAFGPGPAPTGDPLIPPGSLLSVPTAARFLHLLASLAHILKLMF